MSVPPVKATVVSVSMRVCNHADPNPALSPFNDRQRERESKRKKTFLSFFSSFLVLLFFNISPLSFSHYLRFEQAHTAHSVKKEFFFPRLSSFLGHPIHTVRAFLVCTLPHRK